MPCGTFWAILYKSLESFWSLLIAIYQYIYILISIYIYINVLYIYIISLLYCPAPCCADLGLGDQPLGWWARWRWCRCCWGGLGGDAGRVYWAQVSSNFIKCHQVSSSFIKFLQSVYVLDVFLRSYHVHMWNDMNLIDSSCPVWMNIDVYMFIELLNCVLYIYIHRCIHKF